jgi:hypothetical protein
MTEVLIVLSFAAFFAFLSAACGGNGPLPIRGRLAEVLYGAAYAVPLVLLGSYVEAAVAAIVGIAFKVTGHGQYFDLGTWKKQSDRRQFVDPLVELFFGPDPNWTTDGEGNRWRDFCGLTITGIGVGIGLGVGLLLTGHYIEALVIVLTAGLKGVAYLIGWALVGFESDKKNWWYPPTATGEILTGFFGGLGLAWVFWRFFTFV